MCCLLFNGNGYFIICAAGNFASSQDKELTWSLAASVFSHTERDSDAGLCSFSLFSVMYMNLSASDHAVSSVSGIQSSQLF
jgi:hypothetical protein